MAAFDSDLPPLVTRIEAGAGVLVTSDQNSDSELIFNVSIDSDYVQGIVTNQLDKIIDDINQLRSNGDSDQLNQKALADFAKLINQRVFDFDSDQGVVIAAHRSDADSDAALFRAMLDSDSTKIQALQVKVDNLRVEFDSDVALLRADLDSDTAKIQSNCVSIEGLILSQDSDNLKIQSIQTQLDSLNLVADSDRAVASALRNEVDQLTIRADDNDSDHIVFTTKINTLDILVDSETNLAQLVAMIDSETLRVEEIRKDLDSEASRISAIIGYADSDLWLVDKILNAETNITVIQTRQDVDSDRIGRVETSLDSDTRVVAEMKRILDSEVTAINLLSDDLDSDLLALSPTFARLDSDSAKLQELDTTLKNLRVEFDSDVALLRAELDSDTIRIQEHTLRIENLELRADENDSDHILFRSMLDSDNLALQNHGARLDLVEVSLDSEEAYTKNRFVAINTRADSESIKVQALSLTATGDTARLDSDILKMYDLLALQDVEIQRIGDSDYFDSDRVYRSLINNLPAVDSDQLANAVKGQTDGQDDRLDALEKAIGIGVGTVVVPIIPSDSDYNAITFTQTPLRLLGNIRTKWKITNNGGEVRSLVITIAAGSKVEHALRALQYSVNTDVVAMNYLTKFQIDLDGGVGDKLLFNWKKGYENFRFEVEILKSTASDKASFNITQ